MAAARREREFGGDAYLQRADAGRDEADWLTLQQAACEPRVSLSTVRRRIRNGELRNRMVPRAGGFAYLVYIPNSQHGRGFACGGHEATPQRAQPTVHHNGSSAVEDGRNPAEQIRRLEDQVERLSSALARALKLKQVALPEGMGDASVNPGDPYARYRWLVRKRRWWPF